MRRAVLFTLLAWVALLLLLLLRTWPTASRRRVAPESKVLYGRRVKGAGLAASLGYPTVNVVLTEPRPAGVYTGTHASHGRAVVFVTGPTSAECHYLDFDPRADGGHTVVIRDLVRVEAERGSIVAIFNECAAKR